jgi:uncharacterized protein YabE (DUF348 family)
MVKKILSGGIIVLMGASLNFNAQAVFWKASKKIAHSSTAPRQIIVEENGYQFYSYTNAFKVGDFLKEKGITVRPDDFLFPSRDTRLTTGIRIVIWHAVPIKIKVDGEIIEKKVFAKTIAAALNEAGVTISHLDRVKPALKSLVNDGVEIVITRINQEIVVEKEVIEFKTIEKEDPKLKWRKKKIKQEGKEGTREVKYRLTYTNGKLTKKQKLSSQVITSPQPQIVVIGTKIEVGRIKMGRASLYDNDGQLSCASRMFPRGTWLRVTNRANKKQVIVQVTDYGPMRGTGKMIDLDKTAFQKIASLGVGVIEVKVEEILD